MVTTVEEGKSEPKKNRRQIKRCQYRRRKFGSVGHCSDTKLPGARYTEHMVYVQCGEVWNEGLTVKDT